ncbi:hypothetical protein DQ181_09575, partial [Enterococcus faecium]|nr:hypothetical protein [Enterococcus faecium]
ARSMLRQLCNVRFIASDFATEGGMNSCGASPREEQDNRLCVGCFNLNELRTPLSDVSQAEK